MLRNDYDGAYYHIKKALEDCGNYVPAMKAIGEILNSMEEDSAGTKQLKNVYDRYRQDYFEFFELSTVDDESGMEYIE
jgi:DNA-binding ferritin-like protein (Dps family)